VNNVITSFYCWTNYNNAFFPGGRKIIFSLVALAVGFGLVVALGALVLFIAYSILLL